MVRQAKCLFNRGLISREPSSNETNMQICLQGFLAKRALLGFQCATHRSKRQVRGASAVAQAPTAGFCDAPLGLHQRWKWRTLHAPYEEVRLPSACPPPVRAHGAETSARIGSTIARATSHQGRRRTTTHEAPRPLQSHSRACGRRSLVHTRWRAGSRKRHRSVPPTRPDRRRRQGTHATGVNDTSPNILTKLKRIHQQLKQCRRTSSTSQPKRPRRRRLARTRYARKTSPPRIDARFSRNRDASPELECPSPHVQADAAAEVGAMRAGAAEHFANTTPRESVS